MFKGDTPGSDVIMHVLYSNTISTRSKDSINAEYCCFGEVVDKRTNIECDIKIERNQNSRLLLHYCKYYDRLNVIHSMVVEQTNI